MERWRGELRCGYLPVAPIRAGLGALARPASPPTRLPSRPAPAARSFGCWAGSGAEPQHPEKIAIFVIFCFRKNVKDFPQKFGRRPRIAPIILVAAGWVCPSSCLPPKLIKFRPRGITAATGWLPAARTEIKIPGKTGLPAGNSTHCLVLLSALLPPPQYQTRFLCSGRRAAANPPAPSCPRSSNYPRGWFDRAQTRHPPPHRHIAPHPTHTSLSLALPETLPQIEPEPPTSEETRCR